MHSVTSLALRLAAGVFVLVGIPVVFVLMVYGEWREKFTVIPILLLQYRFAIYALRGRSSAEEKMNLNSVLLVIVGGFILIAVACLGTLWFGRWFSALIVAIIYLAFVLLWFVIHRRRAQLARELSGLYKATQNRVLSGLDPSDRRDVLRRMRDNRDYKSQP